MARRRPPLRLEELGARVAPSATPLLPPAAAEAAALVSGMAPAPHGHGSGSYSDDPVQSGAGIDYHLQGEAHLHGLGHFTVRGSVRAVGFVRHGHAGGTLTFTDARGAVTVELQGPDQPAFAALPQRFGYRVVAATGAYAGLSGQGELSLVLRAASDGHGTFALDL